MKRTASALIEALLLGALAAPALAQNPAPESPAGAGPSMAAPSPETSLIHRITQALTVTKDCSADQRKISLIAAYVLESKNSRAQPIKATRVFDGRRVSMDFARFVSLTGASLRREFRYRLVDNTVIKSYFLC
jgi:hypothetical protein